MRTIAGQDEVAERGDVDDVDEHRPLLGDVVDGDVDVGVVGRGDDHELALEVGRLELALDPLDRALGGELPDGLAGVGGDEDDVAVAGEQSLDLLEADVAAADDQALAAASAAGRRCRTASRASRGRRTGRRFPCGTGRRTPCRDSSGRASA